MSQKSKRISTSRGDFEINERWTVKSLDSGATASFDTYDEAREAIRQGKLGPLRDDIQEPLLTPDDFAGAMEDSADESPERGFLSAVDLMAQTLTKLGYGEGVAVFDRYFADQHKAGC